MLEDAEHKQTRRPFPPPAERMPDPGAVPDTFEDLEQARKGSFLNRINQTFQDVLVSSRGTNRERAPAMEAGEDPAVTADDLAIRRARTVKLQRMVVPEGVIIDGSMTSGSETEIAGRIEGDVTVEGRLLLESSALISGNVRATNCRVEGLVEGKMECSDELELGPSGRLNADVIAGKRLILSGQVFGNVSCGGSVRLTSTARVSGDIRARALLMEMGAVFNGYCRMRTPAQRSETP